MNKKQLAFKICDAALLWVAGFSLGTSVHRFSAATIANMQVWLCLLMVVLIVGTVILWFLSADVHENGRSK